MKKRNTFVDFIAAAEHLIKVCSLLLQAIVAVTPQHPNRMR